MIANSRDRLKSLDSLRGLAAFGVLLGHYTYVYGRYFPPLKGSEFFNLEVLTRGVELFFILSGFVIFYSLQNEFSVINFAKKRFIRLYPTYWICIIITFATVSFFGLPRLEVSVNDMLLNFTMLQQVFYAKNVDNSYWTLVPELFFYVIMGVLFWSKLLKNIYLVSIVWLLLSLVHLHLYHIKFVGLLLNLDYIQYFISGIMFYKLRNDKSDYKAWSILFIAFLFSMIRVENNNVLFTLNIPSIVIYGLFLLFIFEKLKILEIKPLLFLGKISYALYLIHQHIGYVIINYTKAYFDSMWVIVPPILVSILLATLVTFYFEKPAIKYLKSKLFR